MNDLTDILYTRGDTEPIAIVIKTSAGVPVDITGWTFRLTVNEEKAPLDESKQLFQLVGALDADPSTGRVTFNPSDTTIIRVGTFFYDLQRVNAAGKRKTLKNGYKFKVSQDITKTL